MTQQAPKFRTFDEHQQETDRLKAARDNATTPAEKKKAIAALKAHMATAIHALDLDVSGVSDAVRDESAVDLQAIIAKFGYADLDELMNDHGYVRKSTVAASTGTEKGSKAKNKRTAKPAGMPEVYKYVLKDEHDDKSAEFGGDLKPGYGRKVDVVKEGKYYRDAKPEEIANMEKALADWKAQNPKS